MKMRIPHRSYPRIPTAASTEAVGGAWVATEKIHGANFVVATDGDSVRFGKRKQWLEDGDAFFGWQLLRARVGRAARSIHGALSGAELVWVYGELFGGGYPHPEVSDVPGLAPVQTGVWYGPTLEFAVFDVVVERPEHEVEFMSHDDVVSHCAKVGLITPPVIGRGSRSELFALEVHRPTAVPQLLGLPSLPDNIAEGHVLKPAEPMAIATRPTVKRKTATFDEARFDASRPFDANAFLNLEELTTLAAQLVNPARIASARSKVGSDRDAVLDEVVLDVLLDIELLFQRRFACLEPDEARRLEAAIRSLGAACC